MNSDFFKFPTTPHLAVFETDSVREDKVLTERERDEFLQHELIVEEKIDGANLGISFDGSGDVHVQNRGAYLSKPYQGQWKKLDEWLLLKLDRFFDVLHDQYILFGEWCFARHSVIYDNLPSWFVGFDIYDKEHRQFLSCPMRNDLFKQMKICQIPMLGKGRFSLPELNTFFRTSCFSHAGSEGLYLRYDHGKWLEARAKLVRPEFVQAIETHWSRKSIIPNKLATGHPCDFHENIHSHSHTG